MPEPGAKALLRNSAALLPPASISTEEIDQRSRRAQSILLTCFPPKKGAMVAIYSPLGGEVGTTLVAEAVRSSGGQVYYPCIVGGDDMAFYPSGADETMVPGRYGIPVPKVEPGKEPKRDAFDMVVVPGRAFDQRGYRLGRGGGYYDRFLSKRVSPIVVGLAFSWQIVNEIPIDPWDVPVGAVVTEGGVIRVSVPIEDPRACK